MLWGGGGASKGDPEGLGLWDGAGAVRGNAMHAVRMQCEVLDSSALRISTFTIKVRHSRITHNPHSFIAFVHLPCVLGLKGLQGIPHPPDR